MKKIYALTLLMLAHYICLSQAKNYFVDGSRWIYETSESQEPGMTCIEYITEQNLILGDTVINATSYKKLFTNRQVIISDCPPGHNIVSYDSSAGQYLRYDTLTERVYFLGSATSTEKLIYDFNLTVGDSLPAAYRDNYIPEASFEGGLNGGTGHSGATIDSIETISLFGSPARKYYINQGSGFQPEENFIIEGLGGFNGFYYDNPYVVVVSGGFYVTSLTCFQSGDSVYLGASCPYLSIPTGIYDYNTNNYSLIIYPNPTTNQLTIRIPTLHSDKPESVFITNMLGQTLYQSAITNPQTEIDVSSLSSGLYFAKVLTDKGAWTGKFIKQ